MTEDTEQRLEEYFQKHKEEWESWLEQDKDRVYTGALCGEALTDKGENK